jgi:ATP-dependent RNA helicase DDX31/DBP7
MSPEVQTLQRRLGGLVAADPKLKTLAADAFRSYLRAYAVHPSHLKPIFKVKGLHLGHIAASFALQEPPSMIGGSGSAKERKRRKEEARKQDSNSKRKKMRISAAAAVAGGR